MAMFKKRRVRETIWAPDEPPMPDPKPEIIAGPAADASMLGASSGGMIGETSGESALGFLGSMAGAGTTGSSMSSSESESARPASSPYGWEPSSSSSSLGSSISSSDSDMTDKFFRLQRKIDNLTERIEELERKNRDN